MHIRADRRVRVLGTVVVLLWAAVFGTGLRGQGVTEVILLHDNDLHFDFTQTDRLSTAVAAYRSAFDDVLLLNAGDVFVRHPAAWPDPDPAFYAMRSRYMIESMNALGYDALTLGNHELAFLKTITRDSLRLASFPILAANLEVSTEFFDTPVPYTTFTTAAGHSIAVLGLSGGGTGDTDGLLLTGHEQALAQHLPTLEGHDLVVVLSHIGHGADLQLAERFGEGVDVIIGGHSHTPVNPARLVNGVLVAQTGGHGHPVAPSAPRHLGVIRLVLGPDGAVREKSGQVVSFAGSDTGFPELPYLPVTAALPETVETGDWPMWGGNAERSGTTGTPIPEADALHPQWIRDLGSPRRAWPAQGDDFDKLEFDLSYSPVVLGNRLYVGSMVSDRMTAYDATTGVEVWRYYTNGPVRLAPAAWNGRVYFGSDDGWFYCLDAETGTLVWRYHAAISDRLLLGNSRVISMWPVRGGAAVRDGIVYFAAGIWPFEGTFLYALEAETGDVVWANTGDSTDWQLQPHGGAYAFAGLAPQGYLAVGEARIVVAGGRTPPALVDRQTGEFVHMAFGAAKGSTQRPFGGYRVRIAGEHYYNHGDRYLLQDGSGPEPGHALGNPELERLAADLEQVVGERIWSLVPACNRVFAVTEGGTLHCFGPRAVVARRYGRSTESPEPETENRRHAREAAAILSGSGMRDGYALCLGVGDGGLLEQLALQSELHVVGIDSDPERIAVLRRRFDAAGLYGTRIALLPGDPLTVPYPPYISSLVVVPDPEAIGFRADRESLERLYSLVKPYGGRAFLAGGDWVGDDPESRVREAFEPVNGRVLNAEAGYLVLARDGGLPGTDDWTHQYSDAANTVCSNDDRVRLPLGILWYGGPSNDGVLPRHGHGPIPHVVSGRIILPGVDGLIARCVYTGRELWRAPLPGLGHPFTVLEMEEQWQAGGSVFIHSENGLGANYIGSPYVSLPDAIYVRYRTQVLRLSPETGEVRERFSLPVTRDRPGDPDWGHISVSGDLLLVTVDPHVLREGQGGERFPSLADIRGRDWSGTSSRTLLALDRHTGDLLWRRDADIGFRHNAIAAAAGKAFVIDGLSGQAVEFLRRRGEVPGVPVVLGLDAASGDELWRVSSRVFGTWLGYSEAHDVLIEAGRRGGLRDLPDEPSSRLRGYRGADGVLLWDRGLTYTGPVAIHDDSLFTTVKWGDSANVQALSTYQEGQRLDLLTGEPVMRRDPLTGRETPWTYWRTYGCNTANVSKHLVLFRSGAAGFADIEHDSGTGMLGGFRSGCTVNLIAANGVLVAPDYTRTCSCSYQNQTSVGLIHMPELDYYWTGIRTPDRTQQGRIRRLGLNLNAPGGRRADNGTAWVQYPPAGAPAPDLDVRIEPEAGVTWYRKHPMLVTEGDGLAWIAASGVVGADTVEIGDLAEGPYTVELHFAEFEDRAQGERVFDVLLQGQPVLEGFDVVRAAGGVDRAVRRVFSDIEVDGTLRVGLRACNGTVAAPLLSGIAVSTSVPGVVTQSVTAVTPRSAVLRGELVSGDEPDGTRSWSTFFRQRQVGDDGWQETAPVSVSAVGDFSSPMTGLEPGGTYEYQAVVVSAPGTEREYTGEVRRFVTGDRFALGFANHHVAVTHDPSLNPGADSYTFELWARLDSEHDAGDEWDLVLAKRGPDGYYIGMNRRHGWNFMLRDDDGQRVDTSGDRWLPLIFDRWVFIQAVVDRERGRQVLRIYDPVEEAWQEAAVTPPPGTIGATNNLFLGKDIDAGRFQIHGMLGPIRFWRGARTREEAEADMSSRLSGTEPGLEACWSLETGYGGDVLPDSSANRNHGQVFGAEWTVRPPHLR